MAPQLTFLSTTTTVGNSFFDPESGKNRFFGAQLEWPNGNRHNSPPHWPNVKIRVSGVSWCICASFSFSNLNAKNWLVTSNQANKQKSLAQNGRKIKWRSEKKFSRKLLHMAHAPKVAPTCLLTTHKRGAQIRNIIFLFFNFNFATLAPIGRRPHSGCKCTHRNHRISSLCKANVKIRASGDSWVICASFSFSNLNCGCRRVWHFCHSGGLK